MKRLLKDRPTTTSISFIDTIFNLAICFVFLFILSFLLIKQDASKPTTPREGKYIVIATWNPGVDADLDLWVKAPNGEVSGFLSRDKGTLSLLRDDLGNNNDKIIGPNGEEIYNPINREEITVRTAIPGEYIVNLHYYRQPYQDIPDGITVEVILKHIKDDREITKRILNFKAQGEEQTAFLFTLNNKSEVENTELVETPIPWVTDRSATGGP